MGIDVHRIIAPDDPRLADVLTVWREDAVEREPGDPPWTPEALAAEFFGHAPDKQVGVVLATVDGEPVGMGWAETASEPDDDEAMTSIEVMVRPAFRGRGLARPMIDAVVAMAEEWDQATICAWPCQDLTPEPARHLCGEIGLTKRQEERCSRALVGDIDDALMDRWIADAATKAAGYRMEQWEGPCPDHLIEAWCVASAGMEDMPLDDLDYTPFTRDVEAQRAADAVDAAWGNRTYRTLVLSDAGEPAGLSLIELRDDRPQVGHQDATAVLDGHRGHGIGRWMKAVNYRAVRAAHPELAVIETYNATSNPWMLDINVAMGFRPHHVYEAWQAPIGTVRSRLRSGSGAASGTRAID